METNNTKNVVTYARVSTARQEDEQTIRNQEDVLLAEISKKGYNVIREYRDDGWSGDTLARPGLDQLRNDAKNKRFDAVLIYDPDRLARRYSYQELIMDELRESGIEVLFITVGTPKNSEDKILYGVRGLFAEYERAKIAERFRLGKVRKIKDGHILVSEPLYGYTYIRKQDMVHGHYVINEKEAHVVRMIFSWVGNENYTLRKVVKRLHKLGISPRKSKRGVWSTSTLSTLLKHRAYIGEAHWGKTYAVTPVSPIRKEKYRKTTKSSRKIRPVDEWYTVSIPPIITVELFSRVRMNIEKNFALSKRNTKNEYLLAKLIWCKCGNRRAGEGPKNGRYLYYRCNDRVLSFPLKKSCELKGINARSVDALVWDKIVELMVSPELLHDQISRWMVRNAERENSVGNGIPLLENELIALKDKEDRYTEAYGSGVYTLSQLQEYIGPLRERKDKLVSQLSREKEKQLSMQKVEFPNDDEILQFSSHCQKVLINLNFQQKRVIVVNVIEKVISSPEMLHVFGNIHSSSLDDVSFNTDDRNRTDSVGHSFEDDKRVPFELKLQLPPPIESETNFGFCSSKLAEIIRNGSP